MPASDDAPASEGAEPAEALAAEAEVSPEAEVSADAEGEPERLQREALELCQSAEIFLDQGEIEDALAALDGAYELMLALPGNGEDEGHLPQAKEDIRRLVATLITRIYDSRRAAATPMTSWDLAMPIVDNEHVQREIKSFAAAEREQFLAGYRRSGRYRPMILAKLEEAGLPSQLSWLPLVESWFKVRALSRAGALGMWQFISSTGRRYGLGRDAWIDERLDPEKSTDAAIAYLTELHGLFGDWAKALAAYNCGEVRVQRLQRRSQEYLDFWDLYELLPRETRRYVPRLFAALQVIEDPGRYGITLPEPDPAFTDVATATVERAVKLESLEAALGLAKGRLTELNPELRFKATPKRSYPLKVPRDLETAATAKIASLPEWKPPQTEYRTHRVRRGETLSVIAQRYRTSVSRIMRSNRIRSRHRIYPGQRLRIPVRGGSVSREPVRLVDGLHTVRRGESLYTIARRYRTTVARLRKENDLSSDVIQPGQRLRTHPGSRSGMRQYQVRSGDTLGAIAEAHRVGLSKLLAVNGLSRRATIYPGQVLVIPE
jgi:membrane-bound lytic murein transglycosylase D